jgi:molybdopterin-dependent oxidoreductase alpha subunit
MPPLETAPFADTAPTHAGGLAALVSTVRHVLQQQAPGRTVAALAQVNQRDGFDCPGCAWPEPQHRSAFEFCENGAKAVAEETTGARADAAFFAAHRVRDLLAWSDHDLGRAGRLTQPLHLAANADCYAPIAWDDAFALIAKHLHELSTPNAAAFYTSGRTSNEAAFLYQLLARRFGTNNLPDCSNLCHESSGVGLTESIGVGKGTVQLDDFALADAILVIGQNPGTNHPRMLTTLQQAAQRGCRIVSINPLKEPGLAQFAHPQAPWLWPSGGTRIAELFVQPRIGGDIAVLKGIQKALLEAEAARPGTVLDHGFIGEHTSGFDAWRKALGEVAWERILAESGVSRLAIQQVADIAARAERLIVTWAMGITQHVHAVANVQEIVNLLLLRGWLGRPGAGACPVRGHSNVQGDRTMGIVERPPPWSDKMGEFFDFTPPSQHGLDVVGTIEAMRDGKVRVFVGLGGNFLSAAPDTDFTAAALRRCALTVHVSTKLNRAHLVHGQEALILPCLGRTEIDEQSGTAQFVTVENSMGVVHRSQGSLAPASPDLRSEPWIVAHLAAAVVGDSLPWLEFAADYSHIRHTIGEIVPGFSEFDTRIRQQRQFALPNAARERIFLTATGRARFMVHDLPETRLGDSEFLLMTLRSHDQYNTTVYGLDDRYRGISGGRRVVLCNADDLAERGLHEGQRVDLVSRYDDGERIAEGFTLVAYDIPRRCAATYFPEANVLVPLQHRAHRSRTPASKSVVVTLRPA